MSDPVLVLGAGIVGLSTALAIAQLNYPVVLIEAQVPVDTHPEDYCLGPCNAFNLASINFLKQLGIWQSIESKARFNRMHVWQETGHLEFLAQDLNLPDLGYIVPSLEIMHHMRQMVLKTPLIQLFHGQALAFESSNDRVSLVLTDQSKLTGQLLIAADGANSMVKKQLNGPKYFKDYQQNALVCTVKFSQAHANTAWQKFLPTGPLAMLPLKQAETCSIVWTLERNSIKEYLSLSDEEFLKKLSFASDGQLGLALTCSKRYDFALSAQHLNEYYKDKIVLIGDALHTIHPLAGQGANLGLADVRSLVKALKTNLSIYQDIANEAGLKIYQFDRKTHNKMSMHLMSLINASFKAQAMPIAYLRSLGLGIINRQKWLKKLMMQFAMGNL